MNKNNETELLKIKHQQASQIVVGLLLCAIFVFLSGYYLGKKRALESFTDQFENDSFADKMAYSICSIYDTNESGDASEESQEESSDNDASIEASMDQSAGATPKVSKKYFAQLAGFGTEQAALKCADQIRRKGLPVSVKEKVSKSSKGKSIKWYQVITQDYEDQQQLLSRIDKISNYVKLKDVKIKEQQEGQNI